MDLGFSIIVIVLLILSIILHEIAHGYAALYLGDPTAKLAGRLTLNPISHIDPLGSVILPGIMVLTSSPLLFGWAKPVPYNPYNLSYGRWGEAFVAFAGAGVNLIIAIVFGILLRVHAEIGIFSNSFADLAVVVVSINLLLALFNLIPFPPLDGSKVVAALLPYSLWMRWNTFCARIESLGPIALVGFLLLFIYVLREPFHVVFSFLYSLIVGSPW